MPGLHLMITLTSVLSCDMKVPAQVEAALRMHTSHNVSVLMACFGPDAPPRSCVQLASDIACKQVWSCSAGGDVRFITSVAGTR